ncbi:hypothetical protein [Lactiplantibacillus plantarum]|uniref:hypothetical protein n=1 Tax=Lactiplantibacillus plantarum TaxID=1590 RepID=UPI0006CB2002|nr:hypothetical protein [Lactiplantibacillus plantarum]ALF14770.1 hypothetical protein AKJ11_06595 [Lactiplantibacillus plantarum]
MAGKIMSKEEAQLQLVMLQSTLNYFKKNRITEHSANGQLLSDFEKHLAKDITNHLTTLGKK